MKIAIQDEDALYYEILDLLNDIKLTAGPLGVNGTLSKHTDLKAFIAKKQKQILNDLIISITKL